MLTSRGAILLVPGLGNQVTIPVAWIDSLVSSADAAIKKYCKRDLELQAYTEYYSGDGQRDIIIRQFPVWLGRTCISALSDGLTLPQSTINVASTEGFHPGTGVTASGPAPTLAIQAWLPPAGPGAGAPTQTTVSYTGTTATSFTGCTGGTGTLSSTTGQNLVSSPAVAFDPNGYWGQSLNGFQDGTLLTIGSQWIVEIDSGGRQSNRGLLKRIGGSGSASPGFYPEILYAGKLAGSRLPFWPRGDGNLRVQYSAGYYPVPADLSYACTSLAAYMIRNMPLGASLSSESLGGYSYSLLSSSPDNPEIGSIQRVLMSYRETSF